MILSVQHRFVNAHALELLRLARTADSYGEAGVLAARDKAVRGLLPGE
jgi:hypothetical protein